jgi:hypothetical protein
LASNRGNRGKREVGEMDGNRKRGKGKREGKCEGKGKDTYKDREKVRNMEKERKKTPSVEERGAGICQVSVSLIPAAKCHRCR